MRLRKVQLRFLALVVALVQLIGPAAASLADAQLEAAGNRPNAASHIEAHGRPECARVHAGDCALCQYLATAFGQPAPGSAMSRAIRSERLFLALCVAVPEVGEGVLEQAETDRLLTSEAMRAACQSAAPSVRLRGAPPTSSAIRAVSA